MSRDDRSAFDQTKPLSSPRRRGPMTPRFRLSPATSPCCGVWVPACAGTTAESSADSI